MKKKPTNYRLAPELVEKLRGYSKQIGVTQTMLIEDALKECLDEMARRRRVAREKALAETPKPAPPKPPTGDYRGRTAVVKRAASASRKRRNDSGNLGSEAQ